MKLIDIYEGYNNKNDLIDIDIELFKSDLDVYLQFLENHLINLTDYLVFENYNKKNLCDIQKDNKDILERFVRIYNFSNKLNIKNEKLNQICMKIRLNQTILKIFIDSTFF